MFYRAHPLIFKKAEDLRNKPTLAEETLWKYIGQSQLGIKFRRQHPASLYVLDFYAHEIKLAIEIDGSVHSNEDVKRNDDERQKNLQSLGIIFLRFTNQQVFSQLEFVLGNIKNEINALVNSPSGVGGKAPIRAGGNFAIIPAIDIIGGKCVRLSQGDFAQKKIYNENPLEVAKQFDDAGIKRLHLVDLEGAKKGIIVNQKILEQIASKTKLVIDFGGGIKTDEDIQSVYNAGATIAAIGSSAVKKPELFFSWVKKYGPEKILLGADVQPAVTSSNALKDCKIAVRGWTEKTQVSVFDFIKSNLEKGVKNIFCTDISKDGMLQGSSVELYKKIMERCKTTSVQEQDGCDDLPAEKKGGVWNLIASGGISSVKDIEDVREAGCSGVIIGKAIYEGRIQLRELNLFF